MAVKKKRKVKVNKKEIGKDLDKPNFFTFWKVKKKEDAIEIVKQTSYAFIVVAIIDLIIGIFNNSNYLLDGIIYIVLGILLLILISRVVSIILLIVSVVALLGTILFGEGNYVLELILIYSSIACTYLTFKFNKK